MPLNRGFNVAEYGAELLEQQVNPQDPVEWAKKKVKAHLWSKQREIIHSIQQNRRTAVQSGHGIGKSFTASMAASWWVDAHPPEETIVVTTAPSVSQVHAILWEEIRGIHSRANLPGEVQVSDRWLIGNRLVGFGRKPQDHDKDAFQGIHRKYVLVIIDEAAGIQEWLWDAARNITTGEHCRVLAIGNPTNSTGHFRKVCRPDSGWNVIKISVFDSPKFTGEWMPPEALSDLTGHDYVDEARKDLGEGSPMWNARVLGEFTDNDEFGVIPLSHITEAQDRWVNWKETGMVIPGDARKILGVDVARLGGDRTAFAERWNNIFTDVRKMPRTDTMTTAKMAADLLMSARGDLGVIDSNGTGAGVYDRLKQLGKYAMPVNSGTRTTMKDKTGQNEFYNIRAAMWWKLKEDLMPDSGKNIMLPNTDEVASDLSCVHWKTGPGGKIVIESKDDIKKRIGHSPDVGDAIVLAWYASQGGVMLDYDQSSFEWTSSMGGDVEVDPDSAVEWDLGSDGVFNFDFDSFLSDVPDYEV